jgi:hypothetical protein
MRILLRAEADDGLVGHAAVDISPDDPEWDEWTDDPKAEDAKRYDDKGATSA